MNIVKKIASWILSEDLELLSQEHESEIYELDKRIRMLSEDNNQLRKKLFHNPKILLPQTMLMKIIELLPDPNRVGTGCISIEELKPKIIFTDNFNGGEYNHTIRINEVIPNKDNDDDAQKIEGIIINVSEYNININIPLRREDIEYNILNCNTQINTFFWDFYKAGIRMIDDNAWLMSLQFYNAQNNVLKELRSENLL